ncbi:orexin receptor type 2 isoform X3 [Brachyhypopomus gauderio]|uniref:orexin receptor type 2 isoform X3 n=1 Tax=Brachyhypopomus gauderio TaxID=698409 RepID=UPI0040423B2A
MLRTVTDIPVGQNMSGITDNYGCNDCLTSGRQLNSTESYTHSHLDEGDELLKYIWREYLYPKQYEWVLIAGYFIVFLVSLVGNTLVCFAVWKNHNMRTVTNYFIVNLSIADILVTIICLPASLVVDITETWFFGDALCRILPYLQTISVAVSVLTLSCIAQDRWYAICHPLKFKSTGKRARRSIVLIWLVSCIIMVPQALVMECSSLLPELLPELTNKTILFTVCDEHWGDEIYPKVYHTCFFIVTYLAPLCLMVLAYIQICHKLWCQQIPGTSSVLQRKWKSLQCSAQAATPECLGLLKTQATERWCTPGSPSPTGSYMPTVHPIQSSTTSSVVNFGRSSKQPSPVSAQVEGKRRRGQGPR